jgi:hypothetical protein
LPADGFAAIPWAFGSSREGVMTRRGAGRSSRGPVNHVKVRSCVIDGEVVCCAAQYKFGLRSIELAGWRHYSAIGLGEMAQEPRANQKKIEAEYKGATALPNKC